MAKRGIKEGKLIPLEEIRIFGDTLVRQTLVKKLEQGKTEEIEADLKELKDSMKAVGQIEMIGVREIPCPKELLKEDGLTAVYQLIFGLRRFLAAQLLDWKKIKAVVLK